MTTLPQDLTLADFIEWEALQEERHEFADGEVSLFPGGTLRHGTIAGEIHHLLFARLHGTPCRPFIMDILTTTERSARYPDVVVTCDERDTRDMGARTIRHPKLIVEVLSESTASVDRGAKLDEYRSIASLEEYVLIDSRRRWAETFRRTDGGWIASLPVTSGHVYLTSVDIALPLEEIYDNAAIPPN